MTNPSQVSQRAQALFGEMPPLVAAYFQCAADPFDITSNPNGYINLGTAENFLPEQTLLDKLANTSPLSASHLHYDTSSGKTAFREAIVNFAKTFLGINALTIDNVAATTGVSSALEMISYILLEPNDCVLTLAPIYTGFYHDIEFRAEANIALSHSADFAGEIDIERLEYDIKQHQPKLLLINNPHNPLGFCYTAAQIREIIVVAKRHNVAILADEIYANSVFNGAVFTSFLDEQFADLDYEQHIHQLYGLAKDFALSGFKIGFFISKNAQIAQAFQNLCYFHPVSSVAQQAAMDILNDHDWCKQLFDSNQQQLQDTLTHVQTQLSTLGIQTLPSNAGIFTLLDMRHQLSDTTNDAEFALFNQLLNQLKVNISPGQLFDTQEPGFFRLCYAKPLPVIDAFIERLKQL